MYKNYLSFKVVTSFGIWVLDVLYNVVEKPGIMHCLRRLLRKKLYLYLLTDKSEFIVEKYQYCIM